MFKFYLIIFAILLSKFSVLAIAEETDDMYKTIVKAVDINDFTLMASQYHIDAVIVSPTKTELAKNSIKRWKIDGEKLYANGGKAVVEMRFKERVINKESAYETGIYYYKTIDSDNNVIEYYSHFADLSVKKNNKWVVIMEKNVKQATAVEFNQLHKWQ
jgi:hypothetical protein